MNPWKIIGWIVLGMMVLMLGFCGLVGYQIASVDRDASMPASSRPAAAAAPRCSVSQIEIVSTDGSFVDECTTRSCATFKGVGVLKNKCPIPIGVQIQITGTDSGGKPISSRELWPASVRNIPPGDYTFSMDGYIEPDPRVDSFTVQVVDIREW